MTRALYAVEPTTTGRDLYFPERTLAQYLSQRGENVRVYAFEKLGVAPIREGYAYLVRALGLDAIVLVDGGTDILLRGDEVGLGTPSEDMASLAAVAAMDVPTRVVACVGFGVDTYHGVCHANWLENLVNTPEFAKAQRQRKKVEALFAELKNQIGLRRLRLRRLKFVREQFFLAAVAQNIKRLVRFLSQPTIPVLPATT